MMTEFDPENSFFEFYEGSDEELANKAPVDEFGNIVEEGEED